MSDKPVNVFLAGVGGQGLVLVNRLLARAAILSDLHAKSTDTHGLAMRGGAVMGTLRMGRREIATSLFPPGAGGFLLGLEPLEAFRWAHMLRRGGTIVTSVDELWPSLTLLEQQKMPADWRATCVAGGIKVRTVPGVKLALLAGDYRMLNVVMAGAISAFLPLDFEMVKEATEAQVPRGTFDKNLKALMLGWDAAQTA
ncbi:MAG: 2-oxoacid:acceptor oxidoreductase family protein [Candidatus Lernaella stagnicola]|nr:2-oxoacid:acceptor oxidoreductase family protein [Candidatus Lernaella stagnicola]